MRFIIPNQSLFIDWPHPKWCVGMAGDTTYCTFCGQRWDTNDPQPPSCTYRNEEDSNL